MENLTEELLLLERKDFRKAIKRLNSAWNLADHQEHVRFGISQTGKMQSSFQLFWLGMPEKMVCEIFMQNCSQAHFKWNMILSSGELESTAQVT